MLPGHFCWLENILCNSIIYDFLASCVEVYIAMEPSDCDSWVPPNEADEPVYICSNDKEESKRIILHCCTSSLPCIGWTGEWWYRDASDPNSSFKKYPQAGGQTAWVYVNNTNYPIRYLCNISSSYICEKGSGYIDIQRGTAVLNVRIYNQVSKMNYVKEKSTSYVIM